MERRNYRKVFLRLWRNPNFHALAEAGKLLAVYLLAGPQTNRIGLFRVSLAGVCEDTDLSMEQARAGVVRVCDAFGWQWDARASVIFIPSWWDYNGCGDNEKAWKGALSDLNDVPRTQLIAAFCDATCRHRPVLQPVLEKWKAALSPDTQSRVEIPVRIPNPSQSPLEDEDKHERKAEAEGADGASAAAAASPVISTGLPAFVGKQHPIRDYPRLRLFPFMRDELLAMLGKHAIDFDLDKYLLQLDGSGQPLPAKMWPWLKELVAAEAAKRGMGAASLDKKPAGGRVIPGVAETQRLLDTIRGPVN